MISVILWRCELVLLTAYGSKIMELAETTIFGVPLEDACIRSNALVPLPLTQSIRWLNTKGLDEEGLYRVPGSHSQVEEYKMRFDKGFSKNALVLICRASS
jgi:hypothetical protein